MNICFKLKPYAVSCSEHVENIYEFDQEEQELIYDVFVRIVRNFKQVYEEVDININREKDLVVINMFDNFSEEEFEYFVDIISGHQEDNIVFFDDNEFVIRGQLQNEKETILDRFNNLARDLTPELVNLENT